MNAAADFKDYYATLGVSRDAGDAEIKKAFRTLARKHHPDVARDKKAAEEKFKEINEAYEVLSDPAKRRKYDELGARWQDAEFAAPPGGAQNGHSGEFHFDGTGFSDFFEQFFGGGAGVNGAEFTGAPRGPTRGADIEGDLLVTLDEVLHGAVRSLSLEHRDAQTGHAEIHTFKVRIPPGAQDGQRIRVSGKGAAGPAGGEPGDLFLRVRLAAHPEFHARGADLYHDLELAPWDAVLGTQTSVPTLTGQVSVRVPAGTDAGQRLRVRGHGLPKGRSGARGDLYVVVHVAVPKQITAEQRALWEQLRETSQPTARAA